MRCYVHKIQLPVPTFCLITALLPAVLSKLRREYLKSAVLETLQPINQYLMVHFKVKIVSEDFQIIIIINILLMTVAIKIKCIGD